MQVQEHSLARSCRRCGKFFFPTVGNVKKGYGIFCSRQCHAKYRVGQAPWNKGLTKDVAPQLASTQRNRVTVICKFCGKEFQVTPYRIEQSAQRRDNLFCSRECYKSWFRASGGTNFHEKSVKFKNGDIPWNSGLPHTQVTIEKLRKATQARWQTPEDREKMLQGIIKNSQDPEWIANQSQVHKELWKDAGYREKTLKGIAEFRLQNPEFGLKISKTMSERWQDPEFVASMVNSFQKKPTKPEQQLIEIAKKHFPQFEYNGDFTLGITIGGMIPDFVNMNGKKQVIELFGDYWHNERANSPKDTELGKIMAYNSLGYRCLIIWEHDLKEKSEAEIVDIVKSFSKAKKK